MKEMFEAAEVEVFMFQAQDIITESTQGTEWEDDLVSP